MASDALFDQWTDRPSKQYDDLNKAFARLVKAEMDALDVVSASDSSSCTDTNWLHAERQYGNRVKYVSYNNCNYEGMLPPEPQRAWIDDTEDTPGVRDMYKQQNMPSHMQMLRHEEVPDGASDKDTI